MTEIFFSSFAVVATMMVAVWLLSIPLKNVGLIDIVWGFGFVLVAWTGFLTAAIENPQWSHLLLPCLTTAWGLRLTAYLACRNIGQPEDHRYAAMRARRGSAFVWSSLLRVFTLQAVILWIISLPIQMSAARPAPGDPCLILTSAGIVFWTIGMFFETVGDYQLAAFKRQPDNKGRVMNRGLWKYTRHPNYFGDFCVWWGHWLVCMAVSDMSGTWWTVLSPALMSFFLIRVSGVALLEKAMKKRAPEYEDYIRSTSSFLPWPPRMHTRTDSEAVPDP
ncbi:MAG: DUF1295 domain-containing protein [Planctomycetaceae bacterium]